MISLWDARRGRVSIQSRKKRDEGEDARDGMLDLDARVEFEEAERGRLVVDDELDGAGRAVLDELAQAHGRPAHVLAEL